MTWWCMEPGHQQTWYWSVWIEFFCLHAKYWYSHFKRFCVSHVYAASYTASHMYAASHSHILTVVHHASMHPDIITNITFVELQMTKKIKKLEKETTMWRSRWENSNKALLEMAEEVRKQFNCGILLLMKTSSHEKVFRVTGLLCGNPPFSVGFPSQWASYAEPWVSLNKHLTGHFLHILQRTFSNAFY